MRTLGLLTFALCSLLLVGSAQAHSEVFERAPALGQVVGGTVDHVDISFWNVVSEASIEVVDPNGQPIDVGETQVTTNGRITTVDFAPLTVEGRYTVNHVETSFDGDVQEGAFSFVFDQAEGGELAPLVARTNGPNWVLLAFVSGVILFLAGIFWPGRSRS